MNGEAAVGVDSYAAVPRWSSPRRLRRRSQDRSDQALAGASLAVISTGAAVPATRSITR